MPSLEYLGMAGSSKHSTNCSAGVHTGGGCEGQGEGADMTVLWGVGRLPQQATSSGQEGLAPVGVKLSGPILLPGLVGFFGGLNHSHHIPDGTQDGPGHAGTCLVHCNTMG